MLNRVVGGSCLVNSSKPKPKHKTLSRDMAYKAKDKLQ